MPCRGAHWNIPNRWCAARALVQRVGTVEAEEAIDEVEARDDGALFAEAAKARPRSVPPVLRQRAALLAAS